MLYNNAENCIVLPKCTTHLALIKVSCLEKSPYFRSDNNNVLWEGIKQWNTHFQTRGHLSNLLVVHRCLHIGISLWNPWKICMYMHRRILPRMLSRNKGFQLAYAHPNTGFFRRVSIRIKGPRLVVLTREKRCWTPQPKFALAFEFEVIRVLLCHHFTAQFQLDSVNWSTVSTYQANPCGCAWFEIKIWRITNNGISSSTSADQSLYPHM